MLLEIVSGQISYFFVGLNNFERNVHVCLL